MIWLSEAEKGKGYSVDFLDITLHAVSRDPEAYPSPCLYTQVIGDTTSAFAKFGCSVWNFVLLVTNIWVLGVDFVLVFGTNSANG